MSGDEVKTGLFDQLNGTDKATAAQSKDLDMRTVKAGFQNSVISIGREQIALERETAELNRKLANGDVEALKKLDEIDAKSDALKASLDRLKARYTAFFPGEEL